MLLPPPAFSEKRLQTIENKRNECKKERKETTKRRQVSENTGFATPTGSGQAGAQSHRGKIRGK
jgi:hypothetical protein